jgi:hypothetical protein
MRPSRFDRATVILLTIAITTLSACADDPVAPLAPDPAADAAAALRTRTYYVAADLVVWDYAPSGMNLVSGQPFTAEEALFAEQDVARTRIGRRH